jgi:L-2-hydroxycarboxylate dehydrogenase (NAD+)
MEQLFTYQQLLRFSTDIFLRIGCSESDAAAAAKALLSADIRGVDSHGVARLSGYVRLWEVQRINASPVIQVIHETPSTAVVDGDAGLGLLVAPRAMEIAIQKASQVGSGWVSVQNSNHFGIAGYHAMMALPHDMIGIAMTNASALGSAHFFQRKNAGYQSHCSSDPCR